jgi:hypothetical protein
VQAIAAVLAFLLQVVADHEGVTRGQLFVEHAGLTHLLFHLLFVCSLHVVVVVY